VSVTRDAQQLIEKLTAARIESRGACIEWAQLRAEKSECSAEPGRVSERLTRRERRSR
jgi:hypothetical protein